MTKHDKLKEKLLRLPANFTYNELVTLLKRLGYSVEERGRSSGSAVMFYNKRVDDKILFHKPHPEKELKKYILKLILEKLKNNNML